MSTFTSNVAPSLAKVQTHGVLHGSDVQQGARKAKDIVADIVRNPKAKSSQSLAAEEVNRALARMAPGSTKRGVSKFLRVQEGLAKAGLDIFEIAGVDAG